MGKRSNFERVERDFYPTPLPAVKALIPHIDFITNFIEPCAGDGSLVDHLESYDKKCVFKSVTYNQSYYIDILVYHELLQKLLSHLYPRI